MKLAKKCCMLAIMMVLLLSMGTTAYADNKGNQDVLAARNGVVRVIYEEKNGYYMYVVTCDNSACESIFDEYVK